MSMMQMLLNKPAAIGIKYFVFRLTDASLIWQIMNLRLVQGGVNYPPNMFGNTDPAPNAVSCSYSAISSNTWKAFDGGTQVFSAGSSGIVPFDIYITLADDITPDSFLVQTNSGAYGPRGFNLYSSDETFASRTLLKTVTGQTGWSNLQTRTYSIP